MVVWLTARPAIEAGIRRAERGLKRAVEGPPVPASSTPQLAGPGLVRKALLLRDGTEVTDRPGGRTVETLGRRMWVDVYDTWPVGDRKPATHVRIGNRRPFGWVPAGDLLAWDTRLVLTPSTPTIDLADQPGGTSRQIAVTPGVPLPVIGWEKGWILLAVWSTDLPWERVEARAWVRDEAPGLEPGVLLSRQEILSLLARLLSRGSGSDPTAAELRLRAISGRVLDREPIPAEQARALADLLPAWTARAAAPVRSGPSLLDSLTRLNETWQAQAHWSGMEFRAIPIHDL
jgi:hypothetical protein